MIFVVIMFAINFLILVDKMTDCQEREAKAQFYSHRCHCKNEYYRGKNEREEYSRGFSRKSKCCE